MWAMPPKACRAASQTLNSPSPASLLPQLPATDRYMLQRFAALVDECAASYQSFQFYRCAPNLPCLPWRLAHSMAKRMGRQSGTLRALGG